MPLDQNFRLTQPTPQPLTRFQIQATHSEIFLEDVITINDINIAMALPQKLLDIIVLNDIVLASALFAATQAWESQEHRCPLDKQERRCPLELQKKISRDEAMRQGKTEQQSHRESE